MQYAMLIYENQEAFATRQAGDDDAYIGAWRAYYKALVDAGVYVGGTPLHVPETATTVRQKDGKRQIQDGPYAGTKEQLGGFILLECVSLDVALEWGARCPSTSKGAIEIRPLAPETKARITGEPV
jgi:hypothetical protein